jgi:DNA-binding NtrC family response regulator
MTDPAKRFMALIVDPDDATRNLASALLEEVGLVPVDCRCATAALDALRKSSAEIALLFTDVRLPGEMGGIGLAREVEEHWPHIALLITSRYPRSWMGKPDHAIFVRKPWLPLQVLVEAEKSLREAHRRHEAGLGVDVVLSETGGATPPA